MRQSNQNRLTGSKAVKLFVYSAGLILVVLAIAKVVMILDAGKVQTLADPIFQVPFQSLMWIASIIELSIGGWCLSRTANAQKVAAIAWAGTIFLSYRLGLWWVGYEKPCSCLGSLTTSLGITLEMSDLVAKTILAYLLIGSYSTIFAILALPKELARRSTCV